MVIAVGIGTLCKFQENWLTFRAVAASLGRERELCLGQVDEYGRPEEREKLLVERTEAILATTTSQFLALHKPNATGRSPRQPLSQRQRQARRGKYRMALEQVRAAPEAAVHQPVC